MIKAATLNKLTHEVVQAQLSAALAVHNFKYIKTKNAFRRNVGNLENLIDVYNPYLEFIDEESMLYLKFRISWFIESPKFEKWVTNNLLNRNQIFSHFIKSVNCKVPIDLDVFNETDFYNPSNSQVFKNSIRSALSAKNEDYITIAEFKEQIPAIIAVFDSLVTAKQLFEHRPKAYATHLRLLVFENEIEQAKKIYMANYYRNVEVINESYKNDVGPDVRSIQSLQAYIAEINTLFGVSLENPFNRNVILVPSKVERLKLTSNIGFKEVFRFNVGAFGLKSFNINDKGEVILASNFNEVVKIDAEGVVKKIGTLYLEDYIEKEWMRAEVRWLANANVFACNNFIITATDELLELPLVIDTTKYKGNQVNPNIKDIVFDQEKSEFHIIYKPDGKPPTYHFVYKKNGELVSSNYLEKNIVAINLERKELIAEGEKNSVAILDFNGAVKANYTYSGGNEKVCISPNGQVLVSYGYATKSQLYNLTSNKKQTLWGHPTYLKNYKENFYNDINHNFGLVNCTFTPNGKYIVGGAWHGKYIVWDTEKFERKELFPDKEAYKIFAFSNAKTIDGVFVHSYFLPYTATLENQQFFINRGYNILQFWFLDNGKYMVTKVGDSLLIWDEHFKNIGYVYGVDKSFLVNSNYAAYTINNQLVIQKREVGFNNNFESTQFKEYMPEHLYSSTPPTEVPKPINDVIAEPLKEEELVAEVTEQPVEAPITTPVKEKEETATEEVTSTKEVKKKGFFARLFKK